MVRSLLSLLVSLTLLFLPRGLAARALAPYEPESGVYLGVFSYHDPKTDGSIGAFEQLVGHQHAIYLYYADTNAGWNPNLEQLFKEAAARGAAIQLGLEPGEGLDRIDWDRVRALADRMARYDVPVFVRFASEMNGSWVPWNEHYWKQEGRPERARGNTPEKYVEVWRKLHDILRERAPRAVMVWNPNSTSYADRRIGKWYPGDEYVDWIGVNFYWIAGRATDSYSLDRMLGRSGTAREGAELSRSKAYGVYDFAVERGKPLMIGECAASHYSPFEKDASRQLPYAMNRLRQLYDPQALRTRYPNLKAITWFDWDVHESDHPNAAKKPDYGLTSEEELLELYQSLISNPYFLGRIPRERRPGHEEGVSAAGQGEGAAGDAGELLGTLVDLSPEHASAGCP